jgi:hypothetical protein
MASILTEHVRQFRADSDLAGRVLPEMERLLKQRMRRKNLLTAPPAYLGYPAVPSWDSPGAFEDIDVDCYIFAVLDRLKGLKNQLRVRPNIDGMIVRNIDHFLLERQRNHDPIGYAVFGNVGGAVYNAVAAGHLRVEGATEGRLHSHSVLHLDPSRPDAATVAPDRLREALGQVQDWAKVLPHLIRVTEEGQEWVIECLDRLRGIGVSAVRYRDLVAVLAARVREDRAAHRATPGQELAYESDEDFATVVRMVWPDRTFEDRDRWEALKRQIADRIAGLDRQQRVLERLLAVFGALVQAIEEGGASPPTQAELIERLGVPRATLSDDFRILREMMGGIMTDNTER